MRALKKDTENKISIEKKIYQPPAGFMVLEEKWLTSSPSRPSIPSSPSSPWETRTGRNQKRRSLPHAYLETHPVRTCNLRRNYSTLDPGNPRTPCKRYNTSQPRGKDSTRIPRLLEQEGAAPLKTMIVHFFSCSWLHNHKEVVDGIYKTPWDYKLNHLQMRKLTGKWRKGKSGGDERQKTRERRNWGQKVGVLGRT